MGKTLTPIGFWEDGIPIKEVLSADSISRFNMRKLSGMPAGSLYEMEPGYQGNKTLYWQGPGGQFIEFIPDWPCNL